MPRKGGHKLKIEKVIPVQANGLPHVDGALDLMKCMKLLKNTDNLPKVEQYNSDELGDFREMVKRTLDSAGSRSEKYFEFLQFYQREDFIEEAKQKLEKPGQFFIHSSYDKGSVSFSKDFDVVFFEQIKRLSFYIDMTRMDRFWVSSDGKVIKDVAGPDLLPFIMKYIKGSSLEKSSLLPNGIPRLGTNNVKNLSKIGHYRNGLEFYQRYLVEFQFKMPRDGFPKKAIGKSVNYLLHDQGHVNLMDEAMLIQKCNQRSQFFVQVLGVNFDKETTVYYNYGISSLKCILLSRKGQIGQAYKLKWAIQAASGLTTLKELGFLHGNFSTSQCFIGVDGTLKIGDLSHVASTLTTNIEFDPSLIKWWAPESLWNKEYSEKSEVWSYGVVVWSIYSEGEEPYGKVSDSQVKTRMQSKFQKRKGEHLTGFSLEMPEATPIAVAKLINSCWSHCLCCRPNIEVIVKKLNKLCI